MKITAKPTHGEYLRTGREGTFVYVLNDDGTNRIFCDVQQGFESERPRKRVTAEEAAATASLFAEAGTVHHETGLTPREILAQRDELLKAITEAVHIAKGTALGTPLYAVKSVLETAIQNVTAKEE